MSEATGRGNQHSDKNTWNPTSGGWRPEDDIAYGQRLALHIFWKYRYLLLVSAIVGCLIGAIIALLLPPVYTAYATIVVDKQDAANFNLPNLPYMRGTNTALDTEIQVLTSRKLAQEVVDELGLHIAVWDAQLPDAAWNRIKIFLGLYKSCPYTRTEQYSRLSFRDIKTNPDLLTPVKLSLRADADGNWKARDQSGGPGEAAEFFWASFTPVIGPAHDKAASYGLEVKPNYLALWDYQRKLTVRPARDRANVLGILYQNSNSVLARRGIEVLLERYFERYNSGKLADYNIVLDYISSEIDDVETNIASTLAEMESFREEQKYYEPTAQSASAVETIAELSRQKSSQEIQIVNIDSLLKRWASESPEQIYQAIQAPATQLSIEDKLIDQLANQIRTKERELLTKTPAHPDVQQAESTIQVAMSQIKDSLLAQVDKLQASNERLVRDIARDRSFLETIPESDAKVTMLNGDLQVQQQILGLLKSREAETRLLKASIETEVRILDAPLQPVQRISPRGTKNASAGAVLGLLLGVLLALLSESSRKQFSTLREIRRGVGLPVIAVLPSGIRLGRWQPVDEHTSFFKRLAEFIPCQRRVIGLVHPAGAVSGYQLAWGLAKAAADGEKRVLIIDLDRAAGSLTQQLGKTVNQGYGNIARGECSVADAVIELDNTRALMTSGTQNATAEQATQLLALLRQQYATVLVCMPDPQTGSATLPPASELDDVLLSVPQQGYNRTELVSVLKALGDHGFCQRGIVITGYRARLDPLSGDELKHVLVPPETPIR
jgi:uncharacterized protein involved in exopolysaccharide biosynthesis